MRTEIIKANGKTRILNLRELFTYRELFYFFTLRDIKVKYKQAFLGFAWVVLQPIIMMSIFSLFFGRALKAQTGDVPYPIFVFTGLIVWNLFASGVTNSSSSMITNANILKKIYFPRLIIPTSSILVALFDFFVSFGVFLIYLAYTHYQSPLPISFVKALYCVPLSILIVLLLTIGLGAWLSSLNIKYRDFRYIVPFLVQILFFVTPVIYPLSIIDSEWIKKIISFNPLYAAINLMRYAFLDTPINFSEIITSSLFSILIFILGLYYFRKTELYFADTV